MAEKVIQAMKIVDAASPYDQLNVIKDGDAVAASAGGILLMGTDNTNYQALSVDTSGRIQSVVATALPAGSNNIGDVDILSIAAGDNNIGNVDIASALPAGDNNIGNFDLASAIPAGSNNIGDVDVASLPAGSIAGTTVKVADFDTTGATDNVMLVGLALPSATGAAIGGTSAAPLRIDPTGTTTQPVSIAAAVTVQQATAGSLNMTEANSGAIKTAVESLATTVSGGSLKVDIQDSSVSVTGTVGVTGVSTLTEQQTQTTALGDIRTAVQLIDDSVLAQNAATTSVKALMLGVKDNSGNAQLLTLNASGNLPVTFSNTSIQVSQASAASLNMTEASGAAIKTAVELIDDAIVTAGATAGSAKVIMAGYRDSTGNATSVQLDASGNVPVSFSAGGMTVSQSTASSLNMTEVNSGAIKTAVELIDNAVYTDGTGTVTAGLAVMGIDDTNKPQALSVNDAGRLQVDIISGGSSSEVAPTGISSEAVTYASVSAGGSQNLDTAAINGTRYLAGVDVTSSVPFKAVVKTVLNGVETTKTVLFGRAGEVVAYRTPHRHYFSLNGSGRTGANLDGFRVSVTNMDTSEAADVYATFHSQTN